MHRQMVSHLARQMGVRALAVDYRLAPEHPFPGGAGRLRHRLSLAAKQGIEAQNIVIAGDSAGGNLTLTTLLKLRDDGDPLPAAAACLSPATDLTRSEDPTAATIRCCTRAPAQPSAALTSPITIRSDPLLSPVYADLHGLPPLLIHAGEDEFLRDDAVRVAGRGAAGGRSRAAGGLPAHVARLAALLLAAAASRAVARRHRAVPQSRTSPPGDVPDSAAEHVSSED